MDSFFSMPVFNSLYVSHFCTLHFMHYNFYTLRKH